MDTYRIEQLGLAVEKGSLGVRATLELGANSSLENPLTHQRINQITFQVLDDQLLPCAPAAVVALPPILLSVVEVADDIALLITKAFQESLFHIERRSAQLLALGLQPLVDPETLELSAELDSGVTSFVLVMDRVGNFRVGRAQRLGEVLLGQAAHRFELSEFRDREALAGYLGVLIDEARAMRQPASPNTVVRFSELAALLGPEAMVPLHCSLEMLVKLSVNGEPYRFAASRLVGRTFRGLLAGTKGMVWAERFELDSFPGIGPLVARLLNVPVELVKLVGEDSPQT
ncbi:hypothetical protein [Hyalangium sp.]|uniref:hypothetical protein n=1 Tax=Hyalangium sp. TaxID=2028555 RepID=UPI002D6E3D32|nr:hypothetical protein [Hyalangium sp.]HYI00693.1 hypothetical protein [Hyalangium sp.]